MSVFTTTRQRRIKYHEGLLYEYGLSWVGCNNACILCPKTIDSENYLVYLDRDNKAFCYDHIKYLEQNDINYGLGIKQRMWSDE